MAADREIHVRCGECEHRFIAAYLPMEMSKVAKLLRSVRCPKCGNGPKGIFVAKPDPELSLAAKGG